MRTSQFSCTTKVILRTQYLCYSICLYHLSIGEPIYPICILLTLAFSDSLSFSVSLSLSVSPPLYFVFAANFSSYETKH